MELFDDKTCAKDDRSLHGEHVLGEFTLPRLSNEWRKPIAERRILGAGNTWRVAVNVSSTHLHPHPRRIIDGPERATQHARRLNARTENLILMVRALDAINATSD